jgi:hypothetical protein
MSDTNEVNEIVNKLSEGNLNLIFRMQVINSRSIEAWMQSREMLQSMRLREGEKGLTVNKPLALFRCAQMNHTIIYESDTPRRSRLQSDGEWTL